jgi:hypothetical protein
MSRVEKYEDWATKRIDEKTYVDIHLKKGTDLVDILIDAHIRRQDWDSFDEYCRRYGHGGGKDHIAQNTVAMILDLATDWRTDENKIKIYFSPHFTTFTEQLVRYLIYVHFLIVAISTLNYLFLGKINFYGYISIYLYILSLGSALICWMFIGMRNSVVGGRSVSQSPDTIKSIVKMSEYFWVIFTVSIILLLLATAARLASFVITVNPNSL